MIRPLYRWKSFWFGVLVIAFLAWSWARSMGEETGVFISLSIGKLVWSGHGKGQICLGYMDGAPEFGFDWSSTGSDSPESWFPPWLESLRIKEGVYEAGGYSPAQGNLSIAHWFLILLFLVPWAGWLAWRWRKVRRLMHPVSGSEGAPLAAE